MDVERPCACCGRPFELNPRARSKHLFCREAACQRERRRRAQKLRRASRRRARESRADYMKRYRDSRPDYRRREAERAAARRVQRRPRRAEAGGEPEGEPAVEGPKPASPGFGPWRAVVEVVGGPDGPEVRVVTEAGFTLRRAAAASWACVVPEAG